MNCENIERNITSFYNAVMLEIERRRLQLNISMQEVCDRSGVADYYYSKALHASTPSGREARWSTLQDIVDAIFPEGYDVIIKPKAGLRLDAKQLRCKIKFSAAALGAVNPTSHRDLMSMIGKKGGEARREKYKTMSKAERQRIASKARKTRRQNRLLRAQIRASQTQSAIQP